MATQAATFIFALPEDESSDQLLIYSATSENGTYTLVSTVTYAYGTTTHELTTLDDGTWYKIKFNNSSDSQAGPLSQAVFGGDFSQSAPFLSVSTGTDGANFATTQDVFDYSTLTTTQVTKARVSQALRRARAVIDLRTTELNLDRFTRTWSSSASRKKFNAQLRVLKEAEINIALGNVYRGLADDLVVAQLTDTTADFGRVSIGQTSIDEPGSVSKVEQMTLLAALGDRYLSIGAALLGAIQPTSVRLHYDNDNAQPKPKFRLPFNGY